jgi:hypothetical protein
MALADRIARHYAPPAPEPVLDRTEPRSRACSSRAWPGWSDHRPQRGTASPSRIEISPAQVDFLRRFGNKLYYDASRLKCCVRRERITDAGAAIDDVEASVRTAELCKDISRLRSRPLERQHTFRLMEAGGRKSGARRWRRA